MRSLRITPNLRVADLEHAKIFYQEFLSLDLEEFNLGWVARYTSSENGAHVQLVTQDATAAEDAVMSVHTPDVDAAYAEALERGYDIVHPLTTEAQGSPSEGSTSTGGAAETHYWHLCVSRPGVFVNRGSR